MACYTILIPEFFSKGAEMSTRFWEWRFKKTLPGGVGRTNGFQKMMKSPKCYVGEMEIGKYSASSIVILCVDGYETSNQ